MQSIVKLAAQVWITLLQWWVDNGHVKIGERVGEKQGVKGAL
jgi:hypothetical protein